MKKLFEKFFMLLGLTVFLPAAGQAGMWNYHPNDDIMPPSPGAAGAINFDGRGFMINGKRVFLLSGSVHYARVPRENWRDILLKLKRAGFNTVETYIFWNYHEMKEGQFDFTTESRDIGEFLDTAKKAGLWAIVRVGPYVCAEWENGGFPTWLYFKDGVEVRKDNKPFLKCVDAWFDRMLPIIAERQIHRGGNVILVQLENEQATDGGRHWGMDMDNGYFRRLLDLARKNGLEVPMYFSGLHHNSDPAPESPIDVSLRESPWIATELWTTWYDRYGNRGDDLINGERHPWRILENGGNGFNIYVSYGGTNFGYFNDDEVASSYDYGTLIGQGGETRELYFRLKRLAYFAGTFSGILAGGKDATEQFQGFARGVTVTARTGRAGTLVFLDNPGKTEVKAILQDRTRIRLAPGEITGLAVQVPVAAGVTLDRAYSRLLGIVSQGDITTMVCFGDTGDNGRVIFESVKSGTGAIVRDAGFKLTAGPNTVLSFVFPSKGIGEELIDFSTARIRVLVMNKKTADRTWFVDTTAGRQIVTGAPYLGEFNLNTSGSPEYSIDYFFGAQAPSELTIYDAKGAQKFKLPSIHSVSPEKIYPVRWEMAMYVPPGPDSGTWFSLPDGNPPAMGQDGDTSAFAWYFTKVSNNSAVNLLKLKRIGDRASFFVDGKLAAYYDAKIMGDAFEVPIAIGTGNHELAVFTAHAGRSKFYAVTGSLGFLEAKKGLTGPVVSGDGSMTITGWKMKGGVFPDDPGLKWSAPADNGGIPAYYRTIFNLTRTPEAGCVYRFATDGLSGGSVWLNGHNLGRYPEILKGCPGIWLPSCWMKAGGNSLVVFDEQGKSPEKTSIRPEENAGRHHIYEGGEGVTSFFRAGSWFSSPVADDKPITENRTILEGQPGPFLPGEYGFSTHKGKIVYIHLKQWHEKELILPGIPAGVINAAVLTGGHAGFLQSGNKIRVFLDTETGNGKETIVALQLDRPADEIKPVAATGRPNPGPKPAGTVYEAEDASLSGGAGIAADHDDFSGTGFIAGYYSGLGQKTEFKVKVEQGGRHKAVIRYSNGMGSAQTLSLYIAGKFAQRLKFQTTSDWETWGNLDLELDLDKGDNTVAIQKEKGGGCVNLDYLAVQ
jgi:beta-galactosidase